MLLQLASLAVTNGLAMLRLLPTSDRAKDVEILALRHQLAVVQRQLNSQGHQVRFAPADRAILAALLHRLPRHVLHQIRLVVRPETVPPETGPSRRSSLLIFELARTVDAPANGGVRSAERQIDRCVALPTSSRLATH